MKRSALDWFLNIGIWLLFVLLLVPAIVLGFVLGRSEKQETKTVVQTPAMAARTLVADAPRFSKDDLWQTAGDDWITNGGSLSNQRFSSLDEINADNVGEVKGVWMTDLKNSGVAAKYSQEAQPIAYKGVIYVPTGEDDVFAVEVDSGDILWQYEANLDQTISTVCCGWESRGVAIGDGRVYIGQLDGKLVALEQKTGKVAWERQVTRWEQGGTITMAPLYFDGMVIVGISGGEFGIRGHVTAYDAATGQQRWRFYTIPGPGQVGHDTWPADSDQWKNGGAPVWQTPAVDPELGTMYFSTGNAADDLDGSKRPGDNLFTASIVAIDAKTGKYKWHFQEVHHDIWDYDAPSPVVLFDHGDTKGLGQPSKTGWLYLLDRETGKPLVPIDEKPVPQDAFQKTSKTQPFPSNKPFVDHVVSKAQFDEIVKITRASLKGKPMEIVNGKTIFAPPGHDRYVVVTPGAQGGTNWPPSSYNPDTNMFYVCAQVTVNADLAASMQHEAKQGQVPAANFGSIFTATGFTKNPGTLTAIEATTGKIKWQRRWVGDSCYSGTTTTHGNLVFVGRNNGELQAYTADEGNLVWRFQTGAGANTTATFFRWKGHEYISFLAGGNSLAGTPHGDNLWLFGLDGKLGPVKPGSGANAVEHAGEAPNNNKGPDENAGTTGQGNAAAGKAVFAENCSVCHGAGGQGGNGGPDLTGDADAKVLAKVVDQVAHGGGGMPAFEGSLTDKQINDVSAYVTKQIAK